VHGIWSPSKSALNAAQTSGWELDGLTLDEDRLERLMPGRCSVGARFRRIG
jgi:hypothetical protein